MALQLQARIKMVDDCYFTPKQLAERWHTSEQTLANWRSLNKGPPCIRISNRVLYPAKLVLEHEEKLLEQNLKKQTNSWLIQEH